MRDVPPRKDVETGASSCRERTRMSGGDEVGRPVWSCEAKASMEMGVRAQLNVRM